jgi:hypothetical protein
MGQPISVVEKTSSVPGVFRYETNRSLTGMGKEIYRSPDDIIKNRPPDLLAGRLFEAGGVEEVSVYGGVVTVRASGDSARYKEIIEGLYTFYQPGDPYPEAPTAPEG